MNKMENGKNITITVEPPTKKVSWVLVVGIVLVVVIIVVKSSTYILERRQHNLTDRQCTTMNKYGKMLVVLHNYRHSAATAKTIMSIYRTSHCSRNVMIVVYQELQNGDHGVYDILSSNIQNEQESAFLNTNVSIISNDVSTVSNMVAIHETLHRNLYPECKWFLHVHPGTDFQKSWDIALIQKYLTTRKATRKATVLTAIPNVYKSSKTRSYSASDPTQWLPLMIGEGQARLKSARKNSLMFPVVMNFKGYLPIISSRKFSQDPGEHIVELPLSHSGFIFTSTRVMKKALLSPLFTAPIAGYATDFCISAALWSDALVNFYLAPSVLTIDHKRIDKSRPDNWDSKKVKHMLTQEYSDFCNHVGVDLDKRIVSGRAQLGLVPGPDNQSTTNDILNKYGSMTEYERVCRSLNINITE